MFVPVAINKSTGKALELAGELEELTLKDIGLSEADLEEFARLNIQVLFPEEDMLVVGQQSRNVEGGRADLVAVDGQGNLVLIELKRDIADMMARREPFEFQAIRYAASYATLSTQHDVVERLYAPYIRRHQAEVEMQGLTADEMASRRLKTFLEANNAGQTFNQRQRIALIASGFDRQTLSACAWLARNGVDISCIKVRPVRYGEQMYLELETLVPVPKEEDLFVQLAIPGERAARSARGAGGEMEATARQSLPRMAKLLEWAIVKVGDAVYIKDRPESIATIIDAQTVSYKGEKLRFNAWGQRVTTWSAINIYEWTVHQATGKTLDALRQVKLDQLTEQQEIQVVIA